MLISKWLVGYAHAFARLEQPGNVQLSALAPKRAVVRATKHTNDPNSIVLSVACALCVV